MALIVYTLNTVPREDAQLADLLAKYNKASLFVAEYAFKHNEFNNNALDKALRSTMQKRFSLPSHVTRTVIKTVSRDIHNLKLGDRVLANLPDYRTNQLVRYEAQTVSLKMEAVHPAHVGEYPFRLSISITNDRGGKTRRPLFPFTRTIEQEHEPPYPMWLAFNEDIGRWQFSVVSDAAVVEQGAEDVGVDDVMDYEFNPDYQEPDYTPPEDIYE